MDPPEAPKGARSPRSMSQGYEDEFSGVGDDIFQDYTHPKALDFTHVESWETFAHDLTKACESLFPQRSGEYEGVHALLMNWAADDLGTDTELSDMHDMFRNHFNFSSEVWKIPTRDPENALERKLFELKTQIRSQNQLLIVYYGGHGRFDPSGRSIWQAYRNVQGKAKSPTLFWSTLQPMLQRALCDVLILLDCCYAGSAARTEISGIKELLAACGRETTTVEVCDRSFTRNLMRKIKSFDGQPFTVNQLYERLLNDRKRMINTPQYAPLSGRVRSSIVLTPLKSEQAVDDLGLSVHSSTDFGSNRSTSLTSASNSPAPSSKTEVSGLSSPSENPRVLIALSLAAKAGVPEIEQWKHWLSTDAPDDVRRLECTIETAYPSHSTLVLISVPVSVWNHLPDTSAYRFVDFIKSGNLLASPTKQLDHRKVISTVKEDAKINASSIEILDDGQKSSIRDSISSSTSKPALTSSIDLSRAPSSLKSTSHSPSMDSSIIKSQQPQLAGPDIGAFDSSTVLKTSSSVTDFSQNHTYNPLLSDSFSYKSCPLTGYFDFRIFTIRPGSFDEPIEGTLTTYSLIETGTGETPPYEALSYHWDGGEASLKSNIYIDGFPGTFSVRPNLHAALNQLRLTDRPRRLWIDAICINQDDNKEKNAQVGLMADIFSSTINVCVWLGEASPDSTLALHFIGRIIDFNSLERLLADQKNYREWAALSSLMKRRWFSRCWDVLEIALAARATLYCGDACVDWIDFANAVSLLEAVESKGHMISRNLSMISDFINYNPNILGEIKVLGAFRLVDATSNIFRKSEDGHGLERLFSLEALVTNLSGFQVLRPHDIIYAVLHLAKDIHTFAATSYKENVIKPQSQVTALREPKSKKLPARSLKQAAENLFTIDYEKPFFDVCKEFLGFTIQYDGCLDIICRPWAPEDAIPDAERPSWLLTTSKFEWGMRPDGSYGRVNADTLVGPAGLGKRNYNASKSYKVTQKWKFGEGPKVRSMYVEGFVVDSIKERKPYAADGIILKEWLTDGGWTDRSALPPDRFWRTLVADRGPNGVNPPTFYPRACKAALNQSVRGGHISTSTPVHSSKSTIVAKFLRRVQEVIWMRRLIITEGGLLGLAPEMSKKRDFICILYGCSVPVALRRTADPVTNEEYYVFIGECYVHGLMDGEAFDLARSPGPNGKITKKTFELR